MPPSSAWTRAFCERWLMKAAEYDENTLIDVFDKFFSTFVAFNRLYSRMRPEVRGKCSGVNLPPIG